MDSIILHPQKEQEIRLYEYIAQALKTPYTIQNASLAEPRQKPSDFIGTMNEKVGVKMQQYVNKSRKEWDRSF